MTRAPSSRALSSVIVYGGAGGKRIAARNMPRPAMAASQLFQRLSGRITSAAPAKPRKMRKTIQDWALWRMRRSLGTSRTAAKMAPISKLRRRVLIPSSGDAAEAGAVLILLPLAIQLEYPARLKVSTNLSHACGQKRGGRGEW